MTTELDYEVTEPADGGEIMCNAERYAMWFPIKGGYFVSCFKFIDGAYKIAYVGETVQFVKAHDACRLWVYNGEEPGGFPSLPYDEFVRQSEAGLLSWGQFK